MPFVSDLKVRGLDDVLGRLRKLSVKAQKKATRDAVSQAGKIILWDARAKVRRVSGLLYKSLGRKVKVYRNSGVATAIVGPRVGYKVVLRVVKKGKNAGKTLYQNPTQYSHIVEKGSKRSQAFPFLEAALQSKKAVCEKAMANVISNAVEDAGR